MGDRVSDVTLDQEQYYDARLKRPQNYSSEFKVNLNTCINRLVVYNSLDLTHGHDNIF
jgi:hypothetical protein